MNSMGARNILAVKSKAFAIRVVKLYKTLQGDRHEYVMSKQVLRSGTSIGANIHESLYAQSPLDFISKLHIALKEASETLYWLEILHDTDYITEAEYISMSEDTTELIKMLTSSINTKKSKL